MMIKIGIIAGIMILVSCTGASADEPKSMEDVVAKAAEKNAEAAGEAMPYSGIVREFGSALSSKVGLVKKGSSTVYLCKSEFSKGLSRYANLTVTVDGQMDEEKKCLNASAFKLMLMSSGRPALVGVLKKSGKEFEIKATSAVGSSMKEFKFKKVPKGLRSYTGKKVVLDIVPSIKHDGYHKVVTYMAYPE